MWAGTDSRPHGRVVDEVKALVAAGMPPEAAIGAASWRVGEALGLTGRVGGGLADAVVYDSDPRKDFDVLAHARWVILRGRIQRHP
jgi:imidazolonepropionase-like amidohydrolase